MSIALIGRGASYEFRWRRWALLRDAARAHLDREGTRFPQFYAIGDALGRTSVQLEATALLREVEELEKSLADQPIDRLVIGPHTAAVIYPGAVLDAPRALTANELQQIAPVGDDKVLATYFASMLSSIRDVCTHPADDGTIEALDG